MNSGGSAAARRRMKDSEMAAMMKKQGIKRTTGLCPICHQLVSNGGGHIANLKCKGRDPFATKR